MSIREIIEKVYDLGANRKTNIDNLDQAISAIKSELLGKIEGLKKGRKICFGEDCTNDKNKGFNDCLSQIKKIIEELYG